MQELAERISEALAREESRAERFAGFVRLVFLVILTAVALLNAPSVSFEANLMNFAALALGYAYGSIVFLRIRHAGYHLSMKYFTSCFDILLVFLLLFMYARIDIPSAALKNPVFLLVFPFIALTVFRYDRTLTLITGGLAFALYLGLLLYFYFSHAIAIVHGSYTQELFSSDVTYLGQSTKLLILAGYVLLISYLAQYSRNLFATLIRDELSARSQQERTDMELRIASQVQTQFLPRSVPVIDGLELYGAVQQGRFVGGDYYDFIKLTDDTLLIVAADVSGKGVPAALIMAEVRASTHLLSTMKIPLEEFAARLNALIHESTDKRSFVTFFVAEINTSSQVITYVNAGHPPPVIFHQGEARSLARGTIPLGVHSSLPKLTKHTEEFRLDSVVLAYTDGLMEQANSLGEQFGEERILNFVRTNSHCDARFFGERLLDEVRTFGGTNDLSDDVCICIVKNVIRRK